MLWKIKEEQKVIFRSTFGFNDFKCHHLQIVISSKKVKYDKCLTHSLSPHNIGVKHKTQHLPSLRHLDRKLSPSAYIFPWDVWSLIHLIPNHQIRSVILICAPNNFVGFFFHNSDTMQDVEAKNLVSVKFAAQRLIKRVKVMVIFPTLVVTAWLTV